MSTSEIVPASEARPLTPLTLIQDALKKNVTPEVLKELVALQQSMVRFEWEAQERQAKIDFDEALSDCQQKIGRIAPNQQRNDTASWWADYAQLDRMIRPIYSEQHFSISFTQVAPLTAGKIGVDAILSRKGISRTFHGEITASTTGPKGGVMATATDADAIAESRAKRYLLLKIFNIAVGIDEEEKKGIPQDQCEGYLRAIQTAPDVDALKKVFFAAFEAAKAVGQSDKIFADAKNKRYKELVNA